MTMRIPISPAPAKRFNAGYDCELPPDVRDELVTPRRPPIPPIEDRPRPVSILKPKSKAPLYFVLAICALALAGTVTTLLRQWAAERAISQPVPAPHPTPAPTATPAPLPSGSADRWKEYLAAQQTRASRAELIKLPPPRAQLVRLPEWRIGEQRPVMMPYNLEVLATYRGRLGSEELLPSSGNLLGDMWVVGDTPWVWIWAPSAARADWIDP